ncbi:MAG: PhzF family phenazine biosynthesis protein [Anaerovoracaceae bacterium]|jgi:PhzF family phenazine biosynthesis protein
MRYWITDAFTKEVFGGNPAGVVLIPEGKDYPEDERMRKTAAELRYSETAFLRKLGDDHYQLRFFTPKYEVDLCGHATIGSFGTLLQVGEVGENETVTAETKAGTLNISFRDGFVMMDMASPEKIGVIDQALQFAELYSVMGLDPAEQRGDLFPELISTGLPDIMMPVKTREDLAKMAPDMEALTRISNQYGVTGVHAFTLDSDDEAVCHCRNFSPACGIPEEAATGTASGALTYYLFSHGIVPNHSTNRMIQGEAMERPSEIVTTLDEEGGKVLVRVGGNAAILAEGEINL